MTRFAFGIFLLLIVGVTPALDAQRVTRRFESNAPQNARLSFAIEGPKGSPSGDQIITGWMGSVILGFAAWRAFDEPNGQHSKVRQGWGYTPRAMTALCIGSFVGGTIGIWWRGKARDAGGSLLATAAGVALPSIPMYLKRDDPVLPLILVVGWAPLQGFIGHMTYRLSARPEQSPDDTIPTIAKAQRSGRADDVISSDEIARASARNVYDMIQQLRPHWLTAARLRSPTEREGGGEPGEIVVYISGTRYSGVDALRSMTTTVVTLIRYYDAREATNRFGTGHPAGAIEVTLK